MFLLLVLILFLSLLLLLLQAPALVMVLTLVLLLLLLLWLLLMLLFLLLPLVLWLLLLVGGVCLPAARLVELVQLLLRTVLPHFVQAGPRNVPSLGHEDLELAFPDSCPPLQRLPLVGFVAPAEDDEADIVLAERLEILRHLRWRSMAMALRRGRADCDGPATRQGQRLINY